MKVSSGKFSVSMSLGSFANIEDTVLMSFTQTNSTDKVTLRNIADAVSECIKSDMYADLVKTSKHMIYFYWISVTKQYPNGVKLTIDYNKIRALSDPAYIAYELSKNFYIGY